VPVSERKGEEEMTRTIARGAIVVACMAGLVLGACSKKKSSGDEDATDVVEEDVIVDGTIEPTPDPTPDPTPEPTPDPEEDTTPDAEEDPEEDTEEDVEEDASMDPPDDWPTDLPGDWPVDTSSACSEAGGFCTAVRWEICPVGYEPIDPSPHRGCGGSSGIAGWCCVVAPYSTCSAYSGGNCVAGTSCTGCWGPVSGYTCESGRVCCEDICD
jgi:hypothetical protein